MIIGHGNQEQVDGNGLEVTHYASCKLSQGGQQEDKIKLEKLLREIPLLLGLDCRLKGIHLADIRICAGEEKNSGPELIIRLPLDVATHHPFKTGSGQGKREQREGTGKQKKKDLRFIKELNDVMEKNYQDQDFNVERLAKKLNLSQPTLYRKIKALSGANACDFIRSFRLSRAVRLMENNFGAVIDVALEVGFNSRIYFTKCFKEKFQQTPSQFLETLANETKEPGGTGE